MAIACLVAVASLLPRPARAGLDEEDRRFVSALIRDLGYLDTARRYLGELRRAHSTDRDARAAIDSFLIDILTAEGKTEEARTARAEFQKRYPQHARAALASLEAVGEAFQRVAARLEEARESTTDAAKAEALISEAEKLFDETVHGPLDALVADLDQKFQADRKNEDFRKRRNLAELSRMRFMLLYADFLPAGRPSRKKVLEQGEKLADQFVNTRPYYYVMQYEALIQKGIFLLQLERYDQAADDLSILYDIAPAAVPKEGFPPAVVKAFRDIRLKALLFGTRALNGARRYREAVESFREYYLERPSSDPFYLGKAEDDTDLRRFAVLARLEYGVALAGAGRPQEGLGEVHKIIEKYKAQGDAGKEYVVDARKALGKIAASGDVRLGGRDYYEAGMGLKAELRFEEALRMFQRALATLAPADSAEYGPLSLNEIGEINFILERYLASAIAFQQICHYFSTSRLKSKAATNYLAASTKAAGERPENQAIAALRKDAEGFDDGGGLAVYQARMAQANDLMAGSDYEAARAIYKDVPEKTEEGVRVPFVWRARALYWRCVLLEWEASEGDDAERSRLNAGLEKAIPSLQKVRRYARRDKEWLGMSVASLTVGQILVNRDRYEEAVEALAYYLEAPDDVEDPWMCGGLGYLAIAATRADDEKKAVAAYRILRTSCADDPARGAAAYAISDYYTNAGNSPKAALYIREYAEHPPTPGELENLALVMKIVQILIDGRMISDARQYMERAKALVAKGEGEQSDLERQLLFMEAKILEKNRDYAGVIKALEQYREKFGARGDSFEDPYVWRMLARAHYRLGGKKPTFKDLELADRYYDVARSILYTGLESSKDPAVEKLYWRWVYEWLRYIKLSLGQAGKVAAYKEIILYVDETKHTGMGGYVDRFTALAERAQEALERRNSRRK